MPTPSAINKLTIIRIQVCLSGDEKEGDQGEGDQMETEIVTVGLMDSERSRISILIGGSTSRLAQHTFNQV